MKRGDNLSKHRFNEIGDETQKPTRITVPLLNILADVEQPSGIY